MTTLQVTQELSWLRGNPDGLNQQKNAKKKKINSIPFMGRNLQETQSLDIVPMYQPGFA